jgi:hypothetical protein
MMSVVPAKLPVNVPAAPTAWQFLTISRDIFAELGLWQGIWLRSRGKQLILEQAVWGKGCVILCMGSSCSMTPINWVWIH